MKRTLLCTAVVLAAASASAQPTINILHQDQESYPASGSDYNDFILTDDSDPNSLVKLSTGSYVWFESEGTANPGGAGPDTSGDGGDFLVLFDPDDPSGGTARYEVLIPEQGAESFNSVTGVTSNDIRVSDIVANSSDDLYIAVSDGQTGPPHEHFIVKLPSSGADTFGAPIFVADSAKVGTSDLASQVDLAIEEGSPDTIYFVIDNEADDSQAADDANLFINSVPGSAVNDVAPTQLADSSFSNLMDTLGGVGGTDKTDVDNICYIPSTDQLLVANGGNTSADTARGDIAIYDLASSSYTGVFLDASTLPGTPTASVIAYNDSIDVVGIFWYIGASSASPPENDRIDIHSTDGTYLDNVVTEDDILVVEPALGDLTQFGSAFEISGGDYYIMEGGNPESLVEIINPVTSVGEWMMY